MATMIQIRNVPDPIHRTLKARAGQAGMTLSDFLLAEISRIAERPTADELFDRISRRGAVRLPESSARAVRAERGARR